MTHQGELNSDITLEKTSDRKTGSILCPGQNQNTHEISFLKSKGLYEFRSLFKLILYGSDLLGFLSCFK